jgi:hypothetical protein
MADPSVPRAIARLVQNSYSWWAVLSLLGLWLLVARPATARVAAEPPPSEDPAGTAQETSAEPAPA